MINVWGIQGKYFIWISEERCWSTHGCVFSLLLHFEMIWTKVILVIINAALVTCVFLKIIFSSFLGFPKGSTIVKGDQETLQATITKDHFQKDVELKCLDDLKEKYIDITAPRDHFLETHQIGGLLPIWKSFLRTFFPDYLIHGSRFILNAHLTTCLINILLCVLLLWKRALAIVENKWSGKI